MMCDTLRKILLDRIAVVSYTVAIKLNLCQQLQRL